MPRIWNQFDGRCLGFRGLMQLGQYVLRHSLQLGQSSAHWVLKPEGKSFEQVHTAVANLPKFVADLLVAKLLAELNDVVRQGDIQSCTVVKYMQALTLRSPDLEALSQRDAPPYRLRAHYQLATAALTGWIGNMPEHESPG